MDVTGPFYDNGRHALAMVFTKHDRKMTYEELEFLLQTCNDTVSRKMRHDALIKHLDVFPPVWEDFLDYVYNRMTLEERVPFYHEVFRWMQMQMTPDALKKTVIKTGVIVDLMMIIAPKYRKNFASFWQKLRIDGPCDPLRPIFGDSVAAQMPTSGWSLPRPSRVRTYEELAAEESAQRWKKIMEADAAAAKERREREQREAEEAAHAELERRADEHRRIMLRVLEAPPHERQELMRIMRQLQAPHMFNPIADDPVKDIVAQANDGPERAAQAPPLIDPPVVAVQAPQAPDQPVVARAPQVVAEPMAADEPQAVAEAPLLAGVAAAADSLAAAGEKECVVCLDNVARVALIPCGHRCLCIGCTHALKSRECPVCRQPAIGALNTY